MTEMKKIRNVAIIAHIDHGKTTLIDSILRSARVFRDNEAVEERVMDSNDLERERGITIRSKQTTVSWKDYRINIIDTPGHADFSGEVERILSMVDSVLLLVDANEGPMPQTRYVLMRSLRLGLKPIVIVNKADRPNADPMSALDKTFDLFLELGATDEQADFPVLYGSGLDGWFVRDLETEEHQGMDALFETIVDHVSPPEGDPDGPFLMQITTLAWNDYIGRYACGRVLQGSLGKGDQMKQTVTRWNGTSKGPRDWEVVSSSNEQAIHLWVTEGLEKVPAERVTAGDIVWIGGPQEISIGDTFSAMDFKGSPLPPLDIEEPTVSMFFLVNSGPFSGNEGNAVTIRHIKDRVAREIRTDVALRMEDTGRSDGIKVSGRGDFHLAILIEEMRREGYEFCVSRPEVITTRDAHGKLLEPIEQLVIDVPIEYQGVVIDKMARRRGDMVHMEPSGEGVVRLEFEIPSRGLIGYRNEFLTDTRGLGIMSSRFTGYGAWRGEISARNRGSMISMDIGECTSYALENLQVRGTLFVSPLDRVYEGMIIGENSRPADMACNPTKQKALTNHRCANKDNTIILNTPRTMNLERALEWLAEDELVEVTPKSVRIRKLILNADLRKKAARKASPQAG